MARTRRNCKECGTIFPLNKHGMKRKYCSEKCRHKVSNRTIYAERRAEFTEKRLNHIQDLLDNGGKVCQKCETFRPIEEFQYSKTSYDFLWKVCVLCYKDFQLSPEKQRRRNLLRIFRGSVGLSVQDAVNLGIDWFALALKSKQLKTVLNNRGKKFGRSEWNLPPEEFLKTVGIELPKGDAP